MELDMRAVMAAMRDAESGDDAPPARPDVRAQRLELLARFKSYGERHEFAEGELVAEKHGMGTVNQSRGEVGLMFWRRLDMADAVDALIVADAVKRLRVNRVDCLVALTGEADDGTSALVFLPHEAARLRPLTAGERAELDAVAGGDEPAEGGSP